MPKTNDLFGPDFSIKTSHSSSRKYPNVMWFPRSKTDPREIREVLKIAAVVENESSSKTFNDKSLGEKMARQGSINVIGLKGDEYIKSYKGKSTGDVSYITNARMLMRLFRFWGFVTRFAKGSYSLTNLGHLYTKFTGDFPSVVNGESEETILLQSLSDFTFYSVNDDPIYRDSTFKIRPFVWLLYNLSLEPQCIHQLIVTSFASKNEADEETQRILNILKKLRTGKTTLKQEWINLELDPDDYSCVHNFYDSAKILVYLGTSLGLITNTSNAEYGKKISGNADELKQATKFYELTEKGKAYLENVIDRKPIYYEDLYKVFGNEKIIQAVFLLATLNFIFGKISIASIKIDFIKQFIIDDLEDYITKFNEIGIRIDINNDEISLITALTFTFWQSVPPEIFYNSDLENWFPKFYKETLKEKSNDLEVNTSTHEYSLKGEIVSKFILSDKINYDIPKMNTKESEQYVKYAFKDNVYGGADRFSERKSPTYSVNLYGDKIHVDNDLDALDLIIPLESPDERLINFVRANTIPLVINFMDKSDEWEKDQHYTWVRNCFRLYGCEALYTGSGGMLSRADVSVINPFIAGIEIKSPRENRGTINLKAVRQAVDAKIQVAHAYPTKKDLPRSAIAIGRRISPLAVKEEVKWSKEKQPVLLICDVILYFLCLKTIECKYSNEDLINLFTNRSGVIDLEMVENFFTQIQSRGVINDKTMQRIKTEIRSLSPFVHS